MAKYSVIIAAYNEGRNIGPILELLSRTLRDNMEIVVVDDGSTDDTAAVAEAHGATVLRHDSNIGKGAALIKGIRHAAGEIGIFIDVDGQDLPNEIPLLLDEIAAGSDFVIGSKFIGTRLTNSISTINSLGNRFMSWLINTFFGVQVTDSQSGFKAIRLKPLKALPLKATEYEIEAEMLIKSIKAGLRISEVPVTRDERKYGATSFKRVRHGSKILLMILRERVIA